MAHPNNYNAIMKFFRPLGNLRPFSALLAVLLMAGAGLPNLIACSSVEKHDANTPEGAFKLGEDFEKDERYEEAIAKFTDVKNKFPYSKLAIQAELKIADVNYKRETYIEAGSAYQLFKEFHPKHPQIDYVTYRLAMSFYKQLPSTIDRDLAMTDKAILAFDDVLSNYPSSQYAAESREKKQECLKMQALKELYIATFYLKHQQYDSALKRYETVIKTYPMIGLDAEALYGAAKSAYFSGEKERADQHLKNLLSLYPNTDEARRIQHELH